MVTAGTGLIFGAVLLTSFSSLAGGSIFKSHKTRTYNPDGVSSVGVYVCGSLECPPVRIVEGDCDTVPNATKKFGVCVCNEGFVAHGEKCKSLCEATSIENCATCEIQGGQPTCTTCQDGYYKEGYDCVACSVPTETICAGTPAKDTNNCPIQTLIPCSGETPVCGTDNKTCACPTNCTCDSEGNIIAPDGYYKDTTTTCAVCPDAKAKTCDEEGASTTCVDGYEVKDGTCVESVNVDVGVCDNGNVYLSYMDGPCATETPMAGQTCTSDADCQGGGVDWADNTGCCDTSLSKCKSWISRYDRSASKTYYMCPADNNRSCKKNSDCASGEFCNLVSSEKDCEKPDTGTCTPIGDSTAHTYINGTTKTFWTSPNYLTWWGAENWCKAQGKSLVSYATLHGLFDCDKDSRQCTWDKFKTASNWQDGQTLPDVYWTAESDTSCNVWLVGVSLVDDFFRPYSRDGNGRYALCEDDTELSSPFSNCTIYTDCDEGYFCNFDSACATTGTCKPISEIDTTAGTLTVSGVEYNAVCSDTSLNSFYKAEDWCLAQGGRLLTSSEACSGTGTTLAPCPKDDISSELRDSIASLCNVAYQSNWIWASHPDNNRETCKTFSFSTAGEENKGTYEYGAKTDRRALCLLPKYSSE